MIDNLASVHVGIRLNHGKSGFFSLCETAASEYVAILHQFKLSRVDHDDRTQVQIVDRNVGASHTFQKHFPCFQVELHKYIHIK